MITIINSLNILKNMTFYLYFTNFQDKMINFHELTTNDSLFNSRIISFSCRIANKGYEVVFMTK